MGERRAPAWLEQADQYLEKTKSKFRFALVNEGPPPAGYVDLFVYCYQDEEEKAAWTGFLSDKFVLVDGWADVLVKVRRACAGVKSVACASWATDIVVDSGWGREADRMAGSADRRSTKTPT